ncbi:MAG TPA: hypothetical protein VKZ61_04015 [Thermomicrobiales bacterium]|nr:hypothetical protein [Thermomicrobiales bacterium]
MPDRRPDEPFLSQLRGILNDLWRLAAEVLLGAGAVRRGLGGAMQLIASQAQLFFR